MRFIAGLDPGVKTGFATWVPSEKRFADVDSCTLVDAMLRLQWAQQNGSLIRVVFEDARLRKWFGSKGKEALQGAGSIKRDCQIVEDWCKAIGAAYQAVSPKAKGAKLDADQFGRLTGWRGRTNEHARDAGALVWGLMS